MALVATVLLSVVAASIVLVILRQSLNSTRVSSARYDVITAGASAEVAQGAFEARLARDHDFFLSQVWEQERARVCVANPASPVYQPGDVWPASCGATWSYVTATVPGSTRAEITPPSPLDPDLGLRLLSRVGDIESGFTASYQLSGAGEFTVWSTEGLDLASLTGAAGSTTLVGRLYSIGQIKLPSSTAVTLSGSQVASEAGFNTAPTSASARYYSQSETTGTPPVRDVRTIIPAPRSAATMHASFDRATAIACPGAPATLIASGALTGYSSSLCLTSGAQLRLADDSTVTAPNDVRSWLLLPGVGGANSVQVRYSTQRPKFASQCPTTAPCDLPTLAGPEVAVGSHPGAASHWTTLGSFPLPASGVLATDADTHIGLCTSFQTPGAACATHSGTAPGARVDRAMTVLVGTTSVPKDLYLSGPIQVGATGSLAVVSSGSTFIPYWARASDTDLHLAVDVTALGLGEPSGPPIRSLPSTLAAATGSTDPSWANKLTIAGSLSSRFVDLAFPGFRTRAVDGPAAQGAIRSPWNEHGSSVWERGTSVRITGAQVCNSRTCHDF